MREDSYDNLNRDIRVQTMCWAVEEGISLRVKNMTLMLVCGERAHAHAMQGRLMQSVGEKSR